jgi:hypothetical protein
LCATLCNNTIKLVQVGIKVEDCEQEIRTVGVTWTQGGVRGEEHVLFMATHSIISTYFGSITIVLKFPLTSAASTNGLERYRGFFIAGTIGEEFGGLISADVAEDGVVVLFDGARWARVIERLHETSSESFKLLRPSQHRPDRVEKGHCTVLKLISPGCFREGGVQRMTKG